MLSQTDAVKQAWAATDRTLDIVVTVDSKDYQATEINSLNYDAGAFTGDTLGIGSTYENSVTIEFSSVVEAFKQGLTVLPKVGILVNGKFEYTSLGTFIISEVNRDRNNNLTTIKALDQMCKLEGQYKPTVSAMASPLDIIADIANQGGVTVNTGELQHLPTLPNIKKIEGQTLRTAIGWVAQLYDGFATFDRDGKLTIRTTATPDYTISPSEYQQGGLTKNEVAYKTGGIKVTVNAKKTDDSGQEVDDTTTLQVGETTGSQIELTNDSMTSDLLTTVWTGIKDITYYPYTLNWFGNPGIEAGDWVTLTDTQGNRFNVPINQYTMSFNGGLESTISATQTSSAAGGYAYTGSAGSIKNMIEALQVRHTASGNNVYPPSYQGEPKNPKKGDVWYKQNGNNVEMWIYQEDNGKLSWVRTPLDGEVKAELKALGAKTDEDLTRVKSELSSAAESQWQSMKAATSEVANDLSSAKARLAAVDNDLSATKTSLADTRNSLTTTANDLSATKENLSAVKSDLSATKENLSAVSNDLSATKADLADTGNRLATATAEFQKQTGQLSGSLSTANAKIEFNSNAIAEVKHTAEEVSTTVSNIRVGGRNLLRNSIKFPYSANYSSSWTSGLWRTAGLTTDNDMKRVNKEITDSPCGKVNAISFTGVLSSSINDISLVAIDSLPISGKVTVSFWARQTSNVDTAFVSAGWSGMPMIATNASTAVWRTTRYRKLALPKNGSWTRFWATFDALSGQNVYVGCGNTGTSAEVQICLLKIETGTMATDWTPAPEDTDQAISKVSQTADAIRADLTNTKGDVASVKATASSLQSQITDNKNNISSVKQTADSLTSTVGQMPAKWQQAINDKASAQVLTNGVDMNNLTTAGTYLIKDYSAKNTPIGAWFMATVEATADHTRVVQRVKRDNSNVAYERSNYINGWTEWERIATGTDVSSIKQTMSGITTRVSNAEGNISSVQQTASKLQSDLTNAKGDISSLQQTTNGLTSRVGSAEGSISQLQQTANGLTSTVSAATHNNDSLVKTTTFMNGLGEWNSPNAQDTIYVTDVNDVPNNLYTKALHSSARDTLATKQFIPVTPGDKYNVEIYFNSHGFSCGFGVHTSTSSYSWARLVSIASTETGWVRKKATWTVPNDVSQAMAWVQLDYDADNTLPANRPNVWIAYASFTKIDSVLEDSISQIKQTANEIQAQVRDNKGNISQLQQTATGLQSTVQSQSGQISQLQQDADGLSATVGGAAIDLISNLDQPFVMGFGIPNTTWDGHNACVTLPTTSIVNEVLPQDGTKFATVYNWEAGKTYMQSIIFETDATVTDGMQWTWYTANGHVLEKTTLVKLGNNTYRLIGSHTPTASEAANPLRVFDIINFTAIVDVTTGTYLKFRNPRIWCPDDNSFAQLKLTADGLTTDMKDAKGNISRFQETAKMLQATVGDDNTGLVSQVKAIPGQISSAITASKKATVITSAVDLHNMTTAGYYLLKGTLTNSPVDAWAFLRVITSDSGDRIYHKIWKDDSSTVYTEEWTGEWSGWTTHINSDNLKSNVITAINQSTEGVSITGSKITLDGNVNVAPGFTLSADYIKAGKLSADRISGGTLNFDKIYVTGGLTANSISSGSISGQNLNINLDNGVVEFTKGNLHSTDGGFNISIDNKSFYLDMGNNSKLWINGDGFHLQESASQHLWMNKDGLHNYTDANRNGILINDTTLKVLNNNGEGLVAQNGLLQFSTLPTWLNFGANSTLTAQAYGIIGPDKNLFGSQNGLFIKGREGVVIGTNSYNGETFLGSLFNADSISGSGISLSDDMTKAAMFFTKAPLILAGGPTWRDSNNMSVKPYISVGSEWYYSHNGAGMDQVGRGTYTRGNDIIVSARNTNIIGYDWISFKSFGRIALDADYVHSYPTYLKTTSAGANVHVAPDGALVRSSSARKYKTDIQDANNAYGEKLIEFAPQKWIDKAEKKRYEEDPENNKKPGYYYGLIADDLDAAGLDMLVNYGAEGEVEGINYDRLAVALLPVIKSLKDQVASFKKQLKALTK